MLLEHTAKQLIVGKAVALQNLGEGILGGKQVPVNVGQSKLILIFQEGNAHIFLKETAEISRLQEDLSCGFLYGNRTVVVLGRIF